MYVLVGLGFILWMLFFDANNVGRQVRSTEKLNKANTEIQEYQEKIKETETELEQIRADKEKYARERYFMKKSNEDVFIIDKTN